MNWIHHRRRAQRRRRMLRLAATTGAGLGALLLAGILPGLLQAGTYVIMLLIRFKINPALGPPIQGITWSDRFSSLKGVWGMLLLILAVMGSMYTGLATPTEAAGVGALGALFLALPRLSLRSFYGAMAETARTTALIFLIIAGVLIYVHFLGFTGTPVNSQQLSMPCVYCTVGTATLPHSMPVLAPHSMK